MRKSIGLLMIALLALALPTLVGAQGSDATDLVVLQTVVDTVNGQTRVRTLFVLRDRNGQPVIRDDLRGAQFELDGVATPTTVDEPSDPIKIVLVIDASGSMNLRDPSSGVPLIDEVRAAAQHMVDVAPPNVEFAVFSFAEGFERQHEGFLRKDSQADLIKDAINGFTINPSGTGDTCIYDAASQAIDTLVAAQTSLGERLSVVLFTDGKNREASDSQCSNVGAPEVIRKSLGVTKAAIPIYTIGVCVGDPNAANPCENVNVGELTTLAKETRAFPVIGLRGDLTGLFTRLMNGLSSQWVAETTVCADAGRQVALLSLDLDEQQFSEDVAFDAPQTCLPPSSVEISSLIYSASTDSFAVTLDIANPQRIAAMTVGVYAYEEGGSQIAPPLMFEQPSTRLEITLPTTGMVSGSEYFLRVTAVGSDGLPVLNVDSDRILANSRFPYTSTLSFVIQSVEPQWVDDQLIVTVNTVGVGARPVQFSGTFRDPETGQSEELLSVTYQSGRLTFPIPRMLRAATETRTYELLLETDDNGQIRSQSYRRKIAPRPETGENSLTGWLLIALGAVALCGLVAAVFLLRRRQPPPTIVAPKPGETILQPLTPAAAALGPNGGTRPARAGGTELASGGTMLSRQLRLRIVETPVSGSQQERSISSFPFVIGRTVGGLTLPNDSKISSTHIRIEEAAGGFSLTDLSSSNGTWVGDRRLAKGETLSFHEPILVRLGPATTIELQPE